jgi:hypothetical protein
MTASKTTSGSFRAGLGYLPLALAMVAFATVGTAPAFAKHHHRRIVRSDPPVHAATFDTGALRPSLTRDAALRECNTEAQKYSDSAWETTKSAMYGTCMTEHGQMP